MGGFLNIAQGHINEALGLNANISEKRLKICRKCPLYHIGLFGPVCSTRLWLNPETGDISTEQKMAMLEDAAVDSMLKLE